MKARDLYEQQTNFPTISNSPRLAKVISLVKKYTTGVTRALDIGCGGNFIIDLQNKLKIAEVFGVDISKKAVALAMARGVNARVVDVSNEPLPYPDCYFDFVYCGQVIEHIYDTDHLLDEIKRVLKIGGISIIDTPNLASWYNRLALLMGFQPFGMDVSLKYNVGKFFQLSTEYKEGVGGHIRLFTKRSLEKLLRLHNFEIIGFHGAPLIEPSYTPLPRYLRAIEGFFDWCPSLAGCLIVVVKKAES
jgi:SAM-dependent methyltransferase